MKAQAQFHNLRQRSQNAEAAPASQKTIACQTRAAMSQHHHHHQQQQGLDRCVKRMEELWQSRARLHVGLLRRRARARAGRCTPQDPTFRRSQSARGWGRCTTCSSGLRCARAMGPAPRLLQPAVAHCTGADDACVPPWRMQAVERPKNYAALAGAEELRRMLVPATACKIEEKMSQINELMWVRRAAFARAAARDAGRPAGEPAPAGPACAGRGASLRGTAQVRADGRGPRHGQAGRCRHQGAARRRRAKASLPAKGGAAAAGGRCRGLAGRLVGGAAGCWGALRGCTPRPACGRHG
jgi:hypothetical protein